MRRVMRRGAMGAHRASGPPPAPPDVSNMFFAMSAGDPHLHVYVGNPTTVIDSLTARVLDSESTFIGDYPCVYSHTSGMYQYWDADIGNQESGTNLIVGVIATNTHGTSNSVSMAITVS